MKDYFVRQSNHIDEDLNRGWSSWNYGKLGIHATYDEIERMKRDAIENDESFDISGFELWGDEIKKADTRELYPNYWVLVDNSRGGGISVNSLKAKNLKDAIAELEIHEMDMGDGEWTNSDDLKVVYSKDNLHILERDWLVSNKQLAKGGKINTMDFFYSYETSPGKFSMKVVDESGKLIWQSIHPAFITDALTGDLIPDDTPVDLGMMKNLDDIDGLERHLKNSMLLSSDDNLVLKEEFEKGGITDESIGEIISSIKKKLDQTGAHKIFDNSSVSVEYENKSWGRVLRIYKGKYDSDLFRVIIVPADFDNKWLESIIRNEYDSLFDKSLNTKKHYSADELSDVLKGKLKEKGVLFAVDNAMSGTQYITFKDSSGIPYKVRLSTHAANLRSVTRDFNAGLNEGDYTLYELNKSIEQILNHTAKKYEQGGEIEPNPDWSPSDFEKSGAYYDYDEFEDVINQLQAPLYKTYNWANEGGNPEIYYYGYDYNQANEELSEDNRVAEFADKDQTVVFDKLISRWDNNELSKLQELYKTLSQDDFEEKFPDKKSIANFVELEIGYDTENIDSIDIDAINTETDDILYDVQKHFGSKYNSIRLPNGKTLNLRIADHSANRGNNTGDRNLSVVIANLNPTERFQRDLGKTHSNEIYFDSDYTSDEIIEAISEKIEEIKEDEQPSSWADAYNLFEISGKWWIEDLSTGEFTEEKDFDTKEQAEEYAKKEFEKRQQKMAKGGKLTPAKKEKLIKGVAKQYEGKKVKPEYQDKYGKRYSKKDAKSVAYAIANTVEKMKEQSKVPVKKKDYNSLLKGY